MLFTCGILGGVAFIHMTACLMAIEQEARAYRQHHLLVVCLYKRCDFSDGAEISKK